MAHKLYITPHHVSPRRMKPAMESPVSASSSSTLSRTHRLVLRAINFVLLLIVIFFISNDRERQVLEYGYGLKIKLKGLPSYRLKIVTLVIGLTYNLFRTLLLIFNVDSGKRFTRGLDFVERIMVLVIGTSVTAGFIAMEDVYYIQEFL